MNGRKRHILVDTNGLLITIEVHAADIQDRDGGKLVLQPLKEHPERFPRLKHIWGDAGYNGSFIEWVKSQLGWTVEIVKKPRRWFWCAEGVKPPPYEGFTVLKRRWVVERTFGWLGRQRRLSKDYEYLVETSKAMVYLAMSVLMLRRLTSTRF